MEMEILRVVKRQQGDKKVAFRKSAIRLHPVSDKITGGVIEIKVRITDLTIFGITEPRDFIPDLVGIVPVITITKSNEITFAQTLAGVHVSGVTKILRLTVERNLFRIPLLPRSDDVNRVVT